MRRTLVLLAAFAGLTFAAAPASAAGWTGIVVAKDSGRKAVVTAAADGTVRTARSPKAASLRLGQRLAVTGTKLADGTYRAASVRVTGRAAKVRVKAVVVRNQRAQRRLLVSAGGSTFVLARRSGTRALAARSDDAPKPGDQIVATVSVTSGTAQATTVSTVGHLATIEVEGILTKLAAGSVELIVAKAGFVTIALPAGFALPGGLKVFDEVKLVVSVASDGKLTALAAQGDEGKDSDDDGVDLDEDSHELEVEGLVTALSATSITVQPGSSASPVTCSLGKPLAGFAVGDRVELKCVAAAGGALTLRKIEREDESKDDDDDENDRDDGADNERDDDAQNDGDDDEDDRDDGDQNDRDDD